MFIDKPTINEIITETGELILSESDFKLDEKIIFSNSEAFIYFDSEDRKLIIDTDGESPSNNGILRILGEVEITNDLIVGNNLNFNDINTQIYLNGSDLTFKDANIGVLTLSDLTKSKLIHIVADEQMEGNLNLSDVTNWNVDKAIIKEIIVKTTSNNWNLYILQNDNYPEDDAIIPLRELFTGASGNKDLLLDLSYEDEDDTKEVHLYWENNSTENPSSDNIADIVILGIEAR